MNLLRNHRLLAGVAAGTVVLLALAGVGRWERNRNASIQNERMRAVYEVATAGGHLGNPRLDRYRIDLAFDCFVYAAAGRPKDRSAYELCFDRQGRLVETIDRHTGVPSFASLLEQPSLTTLRLPVPLLVATLVSTGAYDTDPRLADVAPNPHILPVSSDIGLQGVREVSGSKSSTP